MSNTLRVVFWGQQSAGKTSIMARYYGLLKEQLDSDPTFDLVPMDENAKYLAEYNQLMTKKLEFPANTTAILYRSYNFAYCHENTKDSVIPIEWIDYPGAWWKIKDATILHADEQEKRARCLASLCTAEVIFLLVDGSLFIDSDMQKRDKYLNDLVKDYTSQIDQLKRSLQVPTTDKKLDEFVIVLTKADLVRTQDRNFDARAFRETLHKCAGPELRELWNTISPTSKRRYLLLSSGVADKSGKKVQDLGRIGLDAIGPLAFTIASERAQKAHAQTLSKTHDGSTLERVGEAGIGLGTIAGLVAAAFAAGAGPPGWLIAAGIICAGGGSASKIVGSTRRLDHSETSNRLNNVAELSRRLDEQRRVLLHQYYYTEE